MPGESLLLIMETEKTASLGFYRHTPICLYFIKSGKHIFCNEVSHSKKSSTTYSHSQTSVSMLVACSLKQKQQKLNNSNETKTASVDIMRPDTTLNIYKKDLSEQKMCHKINLTNLNILSTMSIKNKQELEKKKYP